MCKGPEMSHESAAEETTERPAYPELPEWQVPRSMAPTNHGRTVASWALVWLCAVGAVVAAVGFIVPSMVVIAVGAGIVVLGLALGVILRAMGKGQPPQERIVPEADETAHLRS